MIISTSRCVSTVGDLGLSSINPSLDQQMIISSLFCPARPTRDSEDDEDDEKKGKGCTLQVFGQGLDWMAEGL